MRAPPAAGGPGRPLSRTARVYPALKLDDVIATDRFAADPFPFYRELQDHDPVQRSHAWNCWVVTRYEDVRDTLQDAQRFSNVGRITGLLHRHFNPAQLEQLSPLVDHYSHGLINIDPPDHTRIRRLLHEVFRPTVIARLATHVRSCVNDLLARTVPGQPVEIVREFAHPLPVRVIAELFGVPTADVPRFTHWSAAIVAFMQSPTPDFSTCLGSQQALLDMRAYLRECIAERRQRTRDDVLSFMVNARSDGDALSDEEILGTSVTLLLGGHETTTRLLSTTLFELAQRPELQDRLRREPPLMETAVEEFLRFSGPFHRDQRVVRVDTEIGGQAVRAGDFVLLMLAAANRDPRQFPDAEVIDPARKPNRHLAFGFGPHVCLGAPLARLELAVALRALLESGRGFRLASDAIAWEFGFLRGPRELRLKFDR